MAAKHSGAAVIGQSGGPTNVINQSLVGAILEANKHPKLITKLYGALNGVQGILDERFVDLRAESRENLELVARTPSSALRSVRKKPNKEECHQIFDVFCKHDVRFFFYIGGNDSAETAHIINEFAKQANYDFQAVHIPKTIDNDLRETDHCPGFGSAASFVARAFMGANLDNRSLPGVYVGVVMGRSAGFLTAASTLGRKYEDDGPHLVYVPENTFVVEKFIADVDAVYKRLGRCIIAVSEGIHDEKGTPIIQVIQNVVEVDSHGNVQLSGSGALGDSLVNLIKERLQIKRVRSDTFGYLQRCFPGMVSEVDSLEARRVGEEAVRAAVSGHDGSIAIKRLSNNPYEVSYELVPLEKVARHTSEVPRKYLKGDNDISTKFLEYAMPLVGPLPEIGRLTDTMVKE